MFQAISLVANVPFASVSLLYVIDIARGISTRSFPTTSRRNLARARARDGEARRADGRLSQSTGNIVPGAEVRLKDT